jgi:hypothetical protein
MNRRDRSNVLEWQKCAAGEARCGGRGAIRRERWTNFSCAADVSVPPRLTSLFGVSNIPGTFPV